MTPGEAPRIAVVGCGAIAVNIHLPALARHEHVRRKLVFVDPDLARARECQSALGGAAVARSHRDVLSDIDGIIVATPHAHHAAISLDAVRQGVAVLCEKPLAERAEDAERLVKEAEARDVPICVNQTRRLHPSARLVRELLRDGAIGRPRRLRLRWGYRFAWPAATGFYFGARDGEASRGVLLDRGSHALDLLTWWLGEPSRILSCRDDARGGTEAVADVELLVGGCHCHVRLSWLTQLENAYCIDGDDGRIHGSLLDLAVVNVEQADGRRQRRVADGGPWDGARIAAELVDNFLRVVSGQDVPRVPARDVLPSVRLVEACYARRDRFALPWYGTERLHLG